MKLSIWEYRTWVRTWIRSELLSGTARTSPPAAQPFDGRTSRGSWPELVRSLSTFKWSISLSSKTEHPTSITKVKTLYFFRSRFPLLVCFQSSYLNCSQGRNRQSEAAGAGGLLKGTLHHGYRPKRPSRRIPKDEYGTTHDYHSRHRKPVNFTTSCKFLVKKEHIIQSVFHFSWEITHFSKFGRICTRKGQGIFGYTIRVRSGACLYQLWKSEIPSRGNWMNRGVSKPRMKQPWSSTDSSRTVSLN